MSHLFEELTELIAIENDEAMQNIMATLNEWASEDEDES